MCFNTGVATVVHLLINFVWTPLLAWMFLGNHPARWVGFPDEPLVPPALVVGPLIELPVPAVISQVLLWMERSDG